MIKNIYLTGFMGSGKSTIGQILAAKLNRRFLDTDALIEARTGKPIKTLFKSKGETYFRALESQVLRELSQKDNLVVSLGGGAILAPQNRDILRLGEWVFLHVPMSVIKNRLKNDKSRPLLVKGSPPAEAIYARR